MENLVEKTLYVGNIYNVLKQTFGNMIYINPEFLTDKILDMKIDKPIEIFNEITKLSKEEAMYLNLKKLQLVIMEIENAYMISYCFKLSFSNGSALNTPTKCIKVEK